MVASQYPQNVNRPARGTVRGLFWGLVFTEQTHGNLLRPMPISLLANHGSSEM